MLTEFYATNCVDDKLECISSVEFARKVLHAEDIYDNDLIRTVWYENKLQILHEIQHSDSYDMLPKL